MARLTENYLEPSFAQWVKLVACFQVACYKTTRIESSSHPANLPKRRLDVRLSVVKLTEIRHELKRFCFPNK